MKIHTAMTLRLAQLICGQLRFRPHGLMSTSRSSAPKALANRSIVTSTNGLALYFSSVGSGMKRISRVVLSTV